MQMLIAAVVATVAMLPATVRAEEVRFPRLVEKGDQVCMQNLDADGRIVESCQSKDPLPTQNWPAAHIPPAYRQSSIDPAESLSWASVKYSWSGPLKWGAVTGGLVGTVAFVAGGVDDDKSLRKIGGYLLLGAGINLVLGLIIDASAADDVEEARRRMAR